MVSLWQPDLKDIEVFKKLNQEKSDKHDEYYLTMLPLLVDHVNEKVKEATGKPIEFDVNRKPVLNANYTLFIAKAIQHGMTNVGLKGRSMGSVSYTFNLDFPQSLYTQYLPRRKVRFHVL
ncbi:hypothetical protein [uncultured Rummeliibacillus sp.]|uniref:hypothetical protein n=1 Tax=uncultured Rummeliibacillus sp. TaxID=762292 RepID=UPI002606678A|nr:hypothetical protein [uncultured Rummeliibacillus sp.]